VQETVANKIQATVSNIFYLVCNDGKSNSAKVITARVITITYNIYLLLTACKANLISGSCCRTVDDGADIVMN
jgi:hypothetical protein